MEHVGDVTNEMELYFDSHSSKRPLPGDGGGLYDPAKPTVEEVSDVKTAVSEAGHHHHTRL